MRAGVSTTDQAVTSLGNLALSILVASHAPAVEFGQFALLYSIYWLLAGFCRAVIGETALAIDRDTRRTINAPLYLAFSIGIIGSVVGCSIGAALSMPLLFVGALFFPILVAQDSSRYLGFSLARPGVALASDVTMLVFQIMVGWLLVSLGISSTLSWVMGWGIGSAVGLGVSVFGLPVGKSTRSAFGWISDRRRLAASVGVEFALNTGVQQLVVFLIPIVSSLADLASVKAAQVSVGPLNVVLTSMSLVILPRMFRYGEDHNTVRLRNTYLAAIGAFAVLVILYAGVLLLIDPNLLNKLFGQSWRGAMPAAVLIALQTLATGVAQIGGYVLRATDRAPRSALLRGIVLPVSITLPLFGAAASGVTGAAFGLLASSTVNAVLWSFAAGSAIKHSSRFKAGPGPSNLGT